MDFKSGGSGITLYFTMLQ